MYLSLYLHLYVLNEIRGLAKGKWQKGFVCTLGHRKNILLNLIKLNIWIVSVCRMKNQAKQLVEWFLVNFGSPNWTSSFSSFADLTFNETAAFKAETFEMKIFKYTIIIFLEVDFLA